MIRPQKRFNICQGTRVLPFTFLSTKWSEKLFTINHYELQNDKCIVNQMYDFGYSSNLILPLTKDRALELFRDGCEIFHLYSDGMEAVVDDETDFNTVDDFYGIPSVM